MTRPIGAPEHHAWGPFRAFTNSGYLRLWIANFLSYTPRWMQMTLLAWLILELSDSPWLVALIGFFSSMPMLLLGLFGGVLADRLNRLRLLILLQVANTAASLFLTITLVTGTVQIWHSYLVVCRCFLGTGDAIPSGAADRSAGNLGNHQCRGPRFRGHER